MKLRVALLCGGVTAFLAASLAPFAVDFSSPIAEARMSERLLSVRGTLEGLTSNALQARLGLVKSYDELAATQSDLREQILELEATIAALPPRYAHELHAAFTPFAAALRAKDEAIATLPAENALLDNSIRLLRATFERAMAHELASGDPAHAALARLPDVYSATLQCYSEMEPKAVADLMARLDEFEASIAADAPGTVRAMVGHARTMARQKERVDSLLHELVGDGLLERLDETFAALGQASRRFDDATDRRRTWVYGASLLTALLLCAGVCLGVLRQNRDLQFQMEQREKADSQARRLEIELRQSQKLEAVGQLAQGIAHEINTPTQYVSDNTRFVAEGFENVARFINVCRKQGDAPAAISVAAEECDIDLYVGEIPKALSDSVVGLERIAKIVRSMKTLAHPGGGSFENMDLNVAIQDSITVATHEWKYVANVVTDLDPELGAVPCLQGEMNQVFLNIIVNAAHAIADVVGDSGATKGTITVRTRREAGRAVVRIEDTGAGIPEAIRERIFEPFFTTKAVGKGSGQGLAIAYSVVVDKHKGTIEVESQVGRGTAFVIGLPLAHAATEEVHEIVAVARAA